ncbi:MAG TPA: DUF1552 domain-containing protein [Polyangiaceae bacterium]|nr:DUF1552 domain-containing protein [Polyangiaceae bacterium]
MKSQKFRPGRRAFLRTIGGLGIGLPFLEGLPERSAFAQDASAPAPTFGMFICTANGVVQAFRQEPEKFWPTQLGPLTTEGMQAFANDRATGLLADYASKLLIVRGVNYPFGNRGCGHALGLTQCLTAAQPVGDAQSAAATGISADTLIASELHPAGVEPLALYAGLKGGYIDEKLSFRAPNQVRAAEGNPWNVYQRLMGLVQPETGASTGEAERLALRRRSVNDLVREELNSLMNLPSLSSEDRSRLDLHFTSVRDIENGMLAMATCSAERLDVPAIQAMNEGSAFRRSDNTIEDVAKLQIDLAAFAFSCNASRVATLQIGDGTDGTRYTINGARAERFHWISHRQTSDGNDGQPIANAVEVHVEIDRLRMLTFKHLLDRFSSYSMPNGTLLDAAYALWTSHVAIGPSHSFNNLPIVIAGGAGGFLRTGQYVDAGGVGNNRLLNTLITANGVRRDGGPVVDFGEPGLAGGLIDSLLA